MRFKKDPVPKVGSIRYIKRFAWFNVEVGDVTLWLESYYEVQKFTIDKAGWEYSWQFDNFILPEDYNLITELNDR